MNISLISVIHPQDNDVIDKMLLYYYNLGIRNFYLMLHRPDSILANIVTDFKNRPDINVKIFVNMEKEHYHDRDCKILTDKALADGMEWIIGSDADELLVLKKHDNIKQFLSEYDNNKSIILHFKWVDYRSESDVYDNAFVKMQYRCKDFMDITDQGWIKSSGKFNQNMSFITGFHNIIGCENIIKVNPEQALFCHFPERNFKQYEQKTMLQQKNWIDRYGFFYMDKDIQIDPDFLKKIWPDRLITSDGKRQICNNDKSLKTDDKMEYVYDPIDEDMFKI